MLLLDEALSCASRTPRDRLRVAILADIPRDALGGNARGRGGGHNCTWLPQLGDAFGRAERLDAWWITYDARATRLAVFREGSQHFVRIPHLVRVPRLSYTLGLALGYWPYRLQLARLLRRIDPAVIHVWGTERPYPAVLPGSRVPTILSMQGILTELARIDGLPASWTWKVMAHYEPKWLNASCVVTTESAWAREKVRVFAPRQQVRVIEYGVHPAFYELKWQPERRRPIVLFCGTLERRKGVDVLLDALELLPERGWECRIAGDGSLRRALGSRRIEGVTFLGNLDWKALQREYARAWCFVLPTLADSGPTVIKEARVVGLPVVTTRHCGQHDYIQDGENGFIVDPLSAHTLARALRQVMSDYDTAVRMGRTHQHRDRERLQPQRTADQFLDLYRELAASRARA